VSQILSSETAWVSREEEHWFSFDLMERLSALLAAFFALKQGIMTEYVF